jgi:hypothetical protein
VFQCNLHVRKNIGRPFIHSCHVPTDDSYSAGGTEEPADSTSNANSTGRLYGAAPSTRARGCKGTSGKVTVQGGSLHILLAEGTFGASDGVRMSIASMVRWARQSHRGEFGGGSGDGTLEAARE